MVQYALDPCAGASWPPKTAGVLSFTTARVTNNQRTPGPIYKLPGLVGFIGHDPRSVHVVGPAYTIKGRCRRNELSQSPGPIYLPLHKNCQPGFSIKSRPKEKPLNEGPGPAGYLVLPVRPCNPGITMKSRHKDFLISNSPGPAAYCLPPTLGCNGCIQMKPSAPCYSITGKAKNLTRASGPGPGAYTIVSDCCYKPCPPKYTIAPRIYPPSAGTKTPGPGTYCPEKVRYLSEPPHYSFGIRWSENANKEILDKEKDPEEDTCPVPCC